MTQLYNRTSEKDKRQLLRNNMTQAEKELSLQLKGKPHTEHGNEITRLSDFDRATPN